MSLPTISVINFSTNLSDQQIQDAIRTVNRQIVEDFMPIWGAGRRLVLHASPFLRQAPLNSQDLENHPVRGESVIYMVDEASLQGALGFHALNAREVPFGFVFTDFLDGWTVTLSHEALELIIDPTANVFVPGPDPRDPDNLSKFVWHTYEVCDAVERTSYMIDDLSVSNFLTPSYFAEGDALGTRNDFLGVGVKSFATTPGSHIAFFDPAAGRFETIIGQQAVVNAMFASRQQEHACKKQSRPSDETLQSILHKCQKKTAGLSHVHGITRTARYRETAKRMKTALVA